MKKEHLIKEIKASEEAIKSMDDTIKKCVHGIEIQTLVLEKFKDELAGM